MRCRWISGCLTLLLTTLGVIACEGSEEQEPETPYERFAADYVTAFCEGLAPCCALIEFSVDSCKTWLGLGMAAEARAVRPENFDFSQEQADRCLADLRTLGLCSGYEPPSCRSVTVGKLPGGSECNGSAECVSSDRAPGECVQANDGSMRCTFPGRAGARGETCAGDCDDVVPCVSEVAGMETYCYPDTGLFCDGSVCRDYDPVGAPCSYDSCVPGAACNGTTCVALAGAGGACMTTDDCTPETYCLNGTCTARLPAGSACTDSDSCLRASCLDGYCFDFLLDTLCILGAE